MDGIPGQGPQLPPDLPPNLKDLTQGNTKDQAKAGSGKANVTSDGVLITSSKGAKAVEKTLNQGLMKDDVQGAGKSSLKDLIIPSSSGGPGTPLINAAGEFNFEAVVKEIEANPWLASGFLVTLTMNMAEIVEIQKQIQGVEANMVVVQMEQTIELAHVLGDLIMQKAELEQAKYLALAIASMVTLAIGVAGASMSVAGAFKGMKAKNAAADLKAETPTPQTGMGTAGGIKPNAPPKPLPKSPRVQKGEPLSSGKTEVGQLKPTQKSPAAQKTKLEQQKAINQAEFEASSMQAVGSFLTQGGSTSLNGALSNLVNMAYTMPIADIERQQELVRATQKIVEQSMNFASKSFNDAGQAIDEALRLLQKIQDDVKSAFSLKG